MNKIVVAGIIAWAFAVSGCAPPQSAQTAAATEQSTSIAQDGKVTLQSRDAPGLAGTWDGDYVGDNGFRGDTTLTLTAASADSVNGHFEYRWGSGNYDRHPDKGTITGTIKNGVLNFGSWALRLECDGEELILRTEQKLGGFPASLRWRKMTPPLRSEQAEAS